MHPRDLTAIELADLLDAAYSQDRQLSADGPDPVTRVELADYLGCHPEVQVQAWDAWRDVLLLEGEVAEDDAEYWLDVEFVEPCPQ